MIEVRTQAEADAAVAKREVEIHVFANVTLAFSGSSQPRVVCSGSSQPRVECSDSSQPRVECYGFTQIAVQGSVHVTATAEVRIRIDGGNPDISGGVAYRVVPPKTPAEWCACYEAMVNDGQAVLFKAVHDDFRSAHNFAYVPGTIPVAPDWGGGIAECGSGLHFCSQPFIASGYDTSATKFIACPVSLSDMAVVDNPQYPDKIKAKGCCGPVWECDEDGNPI